ncbi:MAG: long-chain-fatty-acid--CoA ligase [Cupriavidus necator]
MYITQGLHRALQQQPDAVAVRSPTESLTFAQLGDRIARLAGALRKLGVCEGERVAMLSNNSPRYLEYDLGVPWAGGVLNPVNIRWSQAEMAYALKDSGTSVLIVDGAFAALGTRLASEVPSLLHVVYAGGGDTPDGMLDYEAMLNASDPVEDAHRHGGDLAGIFYTGGTTGFPKGVMLSHSNVCISALASLMSGRCGTNAVFLHVMPMFHLANFAAVNGLFTSGGKHVVLPNFTAQTTLEAISRDRVTEISLAPTMLQMLLDWLEQNMEQANALDLSSLQLIGYGASPISQALLRRAQQVFPSVRFAQGYGMTELAPVCAMLGPEYHTDEAYANGKMRAAGKPSLCTEVRIVDAEDRQLPRGEVGEIVARGGNVMLGYWNQPEATKQALRGGWMHTGDSGYMDEEGLIYVVDRLKDMIVSGGENVYSAEVENAISSHPAVALCAVIGVPHDRWGEAVHALIVTKPGHRVSAESIQEHCRERIARYKCPRSVEFRDALPLSGMGKILKAELRKPYWDNCERGVA